MNKFNYIGLIIKCPYIEQYNCPLKDIRQIDLNDRLEIWNKLTFDQKIKMIEHHKVCIYKQEIL